jgi:hypothetical protein
MRFVTITDHNTVEGALRIAHLPDTFLSVEVTTRFPEDDLPLHVLVWNLSEADHRDLQPFRSSVYELQAFLASRGLRHALAHPLYRMGPPITVSHVERLMLLFAVWEGRNGGRPEAHNEAACNIAAMASPAYLATLADRHGLAPRHQGRIALAGGSDDHGALDIATTWTEAEGHTVESFLASVSTSAGRPGGEHGSSEKLAHAILALFVNAYRESGGQLPSDLDDIVRVELDGVCVDGRDRHARVSAGLIRAAKTLGEQACEGGLDVQALSEAGPRVGHLLLAGALHAPYLASAHHHAGARSDLAMIETAFLGREHDAGEPRVLIFTDTFHETNGVAGTMRHLAAAGDPRIQIVTAGAPQDARPGVIHVEPELSLPLPTSEHIVLQFPNLVEVLRVVERECPDIIQLATPGPVGICGLVSGLLLRIPLVGSYHTELGPCAHCTSPATSSSPRP